MSFAVKIDLQDGASPILRRALDGLTPTRINPVIGRSATNTIREHLFGLNQSRPNRLGGRRTQFYAQAARGTQYQVQENGVVVSINQVGIRQRYFGGTIRPRNGKKWIAVPARSEAHGKTPREFSNLRFVQYRPDLAALLQVAGRSRQSIDDSGNVTGGDEELGLVMYWLKPFVTQKPDPTVLPYGELITSRAGADAKTYVERLWQRGGTS